MKTYELNLILSNLSEEQYKEIEKLVNNLEFNEVIVDKILLKETKK